MTFAKALLASAACLLALASSADARKPDARVNADAPSCEIMAHPDVVLKRGQEVKISWRTRNATSATIDQNLGPVSLGGDKTQLTDRPSATKTYSMSVSGPAGSASCRASVAVPERTEPRQWPPAPMANMPADYLARARAALAIGIIHAKLVTDHSWVFYATSSLLFEQDMEAINAFFANHWQFPAHPELGFGLFSMDSVRLYGLFNGRSKMYPGRLTEAAQRRMLDQFFKVASQMKMDDYEVSTDPEDVWKMRSSENHTLAAESSFFLTAQYLKNNPEFANRTYADGRTPAQHYEAWRKFFSLMLEERAKRGMYIEVGSPSYEDESRQAFQNVRDFAEDPVIARKAEMLLDISYVLMAQETINGVRGGAKSRVYTHLDKFWWGGATDRPYNVLFAPPGYATVNVAVQATSTYYPPPVIVNLAKDLDGRGVYEIVQRVPGVSERGKDAVDPNKSIYRYGFATPSYVLGSFVLDPTASYVPPSSQNRWQGVIFDGDPGARIAPQVTRLRGKDGNQLDREQRVHNGFASVQDRNVLITQRSSERDKFRSRTDLYLSNTLDLLEEEDGWIFVREKGSFAAVKVVSQAAKAYEWLDPRTKNRNDDRRKDFVTLTDPNAPIIMVVNQASDYGNDFARFKAAIKAQPIRRDGGALTFATLTFYGSQKIGSRDGKQVDISPSRVFDSPFMRSDWASGVVYIRKGDDVLTLNLSKLDDPVKTVGGAATKDFPDGSGRAKPIVFGSR